jgi:hypothetical protein
MYSSYVPITLCELPANHFRSVELNRRSWSHIRTFTRVDGDQLVSWKQKINLRVGWVGESDSGRGLDRSRTACLCDVMARECTLYHTTESTWPVR